MGQLHLFSDGVEYYSAETVEEAYAARESTMGTKREDGHELAQLDDDRELRAWIDEKGQVSEEGEPGARLVERTAAEWAAIAMGFVFSSER